jgi:predicted HAD superfamily hydrolase
MYDVTLQLLCTRKSGTLSRVVREINLLGLQYKNHQIEFNGEHTHITVNAIGELNCTRESLEDLFDKFSEVLQVQDLNVSQDGKDVTQFKTTVSETHIAAGEYLTPAVVLAAEKRLSRILGPVASFIVESAVLESNNAGELFSRLAAELNEQGEIDYFLSIIERD